MNFPKQFSFRGWFKINNVNLQISANLNNPTIYRLISTNEFFRNKGDINKLFVMRIVTNSKNIQNEVLTLDENLTNPTTKIISSVYQNFQIQDRWVYFFSSYS